MNETTLKVALAGLMHDIGKFAERAGFDPGREFLENNAALYQPQYKGRYSHKHAVYTAAFIERFAASLPLQLFSREWGEHDIFENLAAGHHKPETPVQWVVAMADRISSGMDRAAYDTYSEADPVAPRDHRKRASYRSSSICRMAFR